MKIRVIAYQKYGKPIKKPITYEFCCWQGLQNWLNGVTSLYKCKNEKHGHILQTKELQHG